MPEEKRRRRRVRGALGPRSAGTPRDPPRPPPGSSAAVPEAFGGLAPRLAPPGMALPEWHIAVKLADQPLAPKSILRLPETELGECPLGGCSISCLKQLITGRLQESVPDPELIGRSRAGGGCVSGQVAWCSRGGPEVLLQLSERIVGSVRLLKRLLAEFTDTSVSAGGSSALLKEAVRTYL